MVKYLTFVVERLRKLKHYGAHLVEIRLDGYSAKRTPFVHDDDSIDKGTSSVVGKSVYREATWTLPDDYDGAEAYLRICLIHQRTFRMNKRAAECHLKVSTIPMSSSQSSFSGWLNLEHKGYPGGQILVRAFYKSTVVARSHPQHLAIASTAEQSREDTRQYRRHAPPRSPHRVPPHTSHVETPDVTHVREALGDDVDLEMQLILLQQCENGKAQVPMSAQRTAASRPQVRHTQSRQDHRVKESKHDHRVKESRPDPRAQESYHSLALVAAKQSSTISQSSSSDSRSSTSSTTEEDVPTKKLISSGQRRESVTKPTVTQVSDTKSLFDQDEFFAAPAQQRSKAPATTTFPHGSHASVSPFDVLAASFSHKQSEQQSLASSSLLHPVSSNQNREARPAPSSTTRNIPPAYPPTQTATSLQSEASFLTTTTHSTAQDRPCTVSRMPIGASSDTAVPPPHATIKNTAHSTPSAYPPTPAGESSTACVPPVATVQSLPFAPTSLTQGWPVPSSVPASSSFNPHSDGAPALSPFPGANASYGHLPIVHATVVSSAASASPVAGSIPPYDPVCILQGYEPVVVGQAVPQTVPNLQHQQKQQHLDFLHQEQQRQQGQQDIGVQQQLQHQQQQHKKEQHQLHSQTQQSQVQPPQQTLYQPPQQQQQPQQPLQQQPPQQPLYQPPHQPLQQQPQQISQQQQDRSQLQALLGHETPEQLPAQQLKPLPLQQQLPHELQHQYQQYHQYLLYQQYYQQQLYHQYHQHQLCQQYQLQQQVPPSSASVPRSFSVHAAPMNTALVSEPTMRARSMHDLTRTMPGVFALPLTCANPSSPSQTGAHAPNSELQPPSTLRSVPNSISASTPLASCMNAPPSSHTIPTSAADVNMPVNAWSNTPAALEKGERTPGREDEALRSTADTVAPGFFDVNDAWAQEYQQQQAAEVTASVDPNATKLGNATHDAVAAVSDARIPKHDPFAIFSVSNI